MSLQPLYYQRRLVRISSRIRLRKSFLVGGTSTSPPIRLACSPTWDFGLIRTSLNPFPPINCSTTPLAPKLRLQLQWVGNHCVCVGPVSKTTGEACSPTSSHPALCAISYFYLPSSRYVGLACWAGRHLDPLEYGRNDSGSSFLGNSSRCKNFTETEVSRKPIAL